MTAPSQSILDARAALKDHFGYPAFRPGQEAAVESVLAGRDTLVVLPTGGGKSLCYQVPALMLPKLTVVISPLISLMKDQVDALTARGLPATFVNSTLTSSQVSDRLSRAMRGDIKLLYVAPERFDFGTTAERLRDAGVSLLAIDEAHCISEWGHDFRPSYLRISSVREKLGNPPTVALTATATPHVRRDIVDQLKLDAPLTIITGFDRKNLTYNVVPVKTDSDKDDALVHLLKTVNGLAVVYASTRKAVEKISALLRSREDPLGGVSRGSRRRTSAHRAGRVHDREGARDRRDERVRHGHRQTQRAARDSLRDARHARGVLSGSGARRTRRRSVAVFSTARLSRSVHARILHQGREPGAIARRRGLPDSSAQRRHERHGRPFAGRHRVEK